SLAALGVAVAIPFAVNDYRTYLSYGPGGLPYNVVGWLVTSTLLRMLGREQFSTKVYEDRSLPLADQPSFLPANFPPQRGSPRPQVGPHPVPQRQLEQLPGPETREKLIRRFRQLGEKAEAKGLVEIRQSQLERQHKAIYVSTARGWHAVAQETRGEISHIHAGLDGSLHVVLHPADCRAIVEAGWGQRHGLAGARAMKRIVGFSLPVNYVLIYAPRDEAEIEIALAIVKASIGFMTGDRG
ncbi:hypothetical protein CC78DRAFT_418474, partial [Lojkania enalia]